MTTRPSGAGIARLEVVVHGRVQGVGYRYHAARAAVELGLAGWVANRGDGTVRCVAEGPRATLERFLEALVDGPPGGWVEQVEVDWSPVPAGLSGFEVRAGSHPGD
jgi:acylphosphatase